MSADPSSGPFSGPFPGSFSGSSLEPTFVGSTRRAGPVVAFVFALAVLAVGLAWAAWFADDAFITFRCLDNFVHGRGLTWNVAERVQAFTNPLWLFLLAAPYAVFGSIYWVSLITSWSAVALLVGLIARSASSVAMAAIGVLLLAGSKAFVEYSVSGMENPLLHLIAAAATVTFLQELEPLKKARRLALLASCAFLTRADAFLFTGILCGATWLAAPRWQVLKAIVRGWSPIVAWELFSITYFGFWLPNTAVAKLGGGLPRAELAEQGLRYLQNSLTWDPLTLTSVLVAVLAVLARPRRTTLTVALALCAHLAYVVSVGGDFMSGRFLSAPFVVAVVLLVRTNPRPKFRWAVVAAVLLLAVISERSVWRPRPGPLGFQTATDTYGVTDERAVYYAFTALLGGGYGPWGRMADGAAYPPALRAQQRFEAGEAVQVHTQIGMLGYFAGPEVHIVDPMGLADPLLARLPITTPDGESLFRRTRDEIGRFWRIGHLERGLPAGYLDSLTSAENRVAQPDLARAYGTLRTITRGPLFSSARWRAILAHQRGETATDIERWRRAAAATGAH